MVLDWELQGPYAMTNSEDDDDDLEVTGGTRNTVPQSISPKAQINDPVGEESPLEVEGTDSVITLLDGDDGGDDIDFGDSEAAYKAFKNRKQKKRKLGHVSVHKVKRPKRDFIVGLRPEKGDKKLAHRKKKEFGDISSEDELMEYTLPDYLRERRGHFDKGLERLKQEGLKLPPDFNEVEFSDNDHLESLREKPAFKNLSPCGKYEDIQLPYSLGLVPAPIAQWLREYQIEGVAFLHELFVYQKGGILGDDMGLGKTVQVIAFLIAAYGKTGDERDTKRMRKMRRGNNDAWYPRTLIVCPGTLIQNWKSEFKRWGWWHVDVYHGIGKDEALQAAKAGTVEVLMTTYSTYRLNKDAINMVAWDCVIADECHIIKERKSETAVAMNEVNALCRIGLTGTAIQNKYEELWTLLNWTNPGKLGPVTAWKKAISDPLRVGQSHDATLHQLSKARKTAKKLVQNLLPAFFLRRMKTLIADQLPKKSDRVVFCPLTQTQADAYENFLDSNIVQYIKYASEKCDCGSGKKVGWCCRMYLPLGGKWQSFVFPAIANLQKLSNHLASLIPQGTDPRDKQDKDLEMLQIAVPDRWRELYLTRDSIINYANPEFCGKWKVLRKLLKWWHVNGDKVLVFSHSVKLLRMLQMLFNHTSYNVSYLDGTMTYEDRAKAVDDFNSDPQQFVFLISTRAGGVGLNITSANKVVIVDPNWNPAHDLQAQDRAYRIGQQRDVEVFRLISAGTIEEIVYARQIYKQQQANIGYNASSERRYFKGVQEKKDQKGEIFGLSNLFEYRNNNIVLRDIVNKTNIAESKAGVQVIGVDIDEENLDSNDLPFAPTNNNEDEDGTMSQLAAMIRGEADGSAAITPKNIDQLGSITSKRHDPIQAILAGSGVEYTHLNNEVIGSSKVEERLSRRAELASEALGEFQVFGGNCQDNTSDHHHRHRSDLLTYQKDGQPVKLKYHPPEDVKRRQFCSMAKRFGFPNATEFALVVEHMTQAQRRACLDQWYLERRELLSPPS